MHDESQRIINHCNEGGIACFVSKNYFVLRKGQWSVRIAKVSEVPLTQGGTVSCMIKNIMPAILAATTHGFSASQIEAGLLSFTPSSANTPGRMNVFDFPHCKLVIDYAHNEAGFIELKNYLQQVNATKKIGVVAAVGDRREKDIYKVGVYAAEIFDEIILRHDKDGRGRTNDELTHLVEKGIFSVKPGYKLNVVSDDFEAIRFALNYAPHGSIVIYCADKVLEVISFVEEQLKSFNLKVNRKEKQAI